MESETIGARNDNAFSPNTTGSPNFRQSLPRKRRSYRDRCVELDRIQRDGIRHVLAIDQARNQCRIAGRQMLRQADTNERASMCHTWIRPATMSTVRMAAHAICTYCEPSRILLRSPVSYHAADQRE